MNKNIPQKLILLFTILQNCSGLVDQVRFHPTKKFTIDVKDPNLVSYAAKNHGEYYYFIGYWRKQTSAYEYLRKGKFIPNRGVLWAQEQANTVSCTRIERNLWLYIVDLYKMSTQSVSTFKLEFYQYHRTQGDSRMDCPEGSAAACICPKEPETGNPLSVVDDHQIDMTSYTGGMVYEVIQLSSGVVMLDKDNYITKHDSHYLVNGDPANVVDYNFLYWDRTSWANLDHSFGDDDQFYSKFTKNGVLLTSESQISLGDHTLLYSSTNGGNERIGKTYCFAATVKVKSAGSENLEIFLRVNFNRARALMIFKANIWHGIKWYPFKDAQNFKNVYKRETRQAEQRSF